MDSATIAHIATAVTAGFLVGVGVWGVYETKMALRLSERAWVTPVGAIFRAEKKPPDPPFEKDRPIHFVVNFLNSGKEPAFSVTYKITNSEIDKFDPYTTTMDSVITPENNTCKGLMPESGRPSLPPSGNAVITMDSMHAESPFTTDDNIIGGSKFYMVQGCVAYRTFGDIHRSAFCYILEYVPVPKEGPGFAVCARGFYTD
jgi:hypothetical protein